jgi:tRNA modification GTPase
MKLSDLPPHRPLAEQADYAAVLTPSGRGAVATIRFVGKCRTLDEADPPFFHAANGRRLADQPAGRIVFGHWGNTHAEEVVVCSRSEEELDIHCHGGAAAVTRILDDLQARGIRVQTWFEQEMARHDLLEAECLDALSRAPTRRTAEILLDQYSGTLRAAFERLEGTQDLDERLRRAADILQWSRFGAHLTQPWKVVLTGKPNVGKSSLVNVLVGYARSIVYNEPGTTRDVVTAVTAFGGWPVELADTAGIRDSAGAIETAGIELARAHLAAADCRVIVLDVNRPLAAEDRQLLAAWPDALVVAHKADLPNVWSGEIPQGGVPVSSKTGSGIDELIARIVARLVPDVPSSGTPVPVTERQCDLLSRADQLLAGEFFSRRRSR